MQRMIRIAKQLTRAVPYLQKELARKLSLRTGRVLTTPITYYVIFGGRCNLACTFCTIRNQPEPTLTEKAMHDIIRGAKELSGHGFNISISGGEPTIYRPLYSALELAHKLDVNAGFTTNGIALTKDNVARILQWNPFNINVSLESTDPRVNEALRPMKDGTRRTLHGIDHVLTEKERIGARVSVIVKSTILEQNFRTLPTLVRHFGRDAGVQINFQPYVGSPDDPHWPRDLAALRATLDDLIALQAEGYPVIGNAQVIQGFLDYFSNPPDNAHLRYLDLGGARRNCDIGLRAMMIFPNGEARFCDFLKQPLGNIYEHSLSEIYYSPVANQQRKCMIYCNIDCQQSCKRSTPLWVKARSFLRMG